MEEGGVRIRVEVVEEDQEEQEVVEEVEEEEVEAWQQNRLVVEGRYRR